MAFKSSTVMALELKAHDGVESTERPERSGGYPKDNDGHRDDYRDRYRDRDGYRGGDGYRDDYRDDYRGNRWVVWRAQ